MKYVRVAVLTTLVWMLASCESADRGGVKLTQKPIPPSIQPPQIGSNEPVSIISATAKCLAVYEPDFHNAIDGSKVQTVDCVAESIYQNWLFTQQREILSDNGQCLATAGKPEAGTLLVLNHCDGSEDQKWMLDEQSVSIRHGKDRHLCVEMPKLTIHFNGSQLVLAPCHGEDNQQWVAQKLIHKQLISALHPELSIGLEPKAGGGPPRLTLTPNLLDWASAAWTLEPIGNFYRIRSQWRPDRFLHLERGFLEAGTISPYWDSAIWMIIRKDDSQGEAYLLRNLRLNNIYIGLGADQDLKAGTLSELIDGSTVWRVVDVNQDF